MGCLFLYVLFFPAFCVLYFVMDEVLKRGLGPGSFEFLPLIVVLAYLLELLPSTALWLLDDFLAERGFRARFVWCTLTGSILAPIPLFPLFGLGGVKETWALVQFFGVIGAAAALSCWCLAEMFCRRRAGKAVS